MAESDGGVGGLGGGVGRRAADFGDQCADRIAIKRCRWFQSGHRIRRQVHRLLSLHSTHRFDPVKPFEML